MRKIALKPRKSLHRISSTDMSTAESVLQMACILGIPDDQRQRQEFEELMKLVYVLRNKGYNWRQLKKLLTETGFKGQFSRVRDYYDAMLQAALKFSREPVMLVDAVQLAEIRMSTTGAEVSTIAGLTAAILSQKRLS